VRKTNIKIEEYIKSFASTSLEEVKKIESPKRTNSKYVFSIRKLPGVLKDMAKSYKLLYVDEIAHHPHTTIYFDTDQYAMYNDHQNGKVNRYKIRYKKYDVSKSGFLELKYKNNKGQKCKKKTPFNLASQDIREAELFLKSNSPFLAKNLTPQLVIKYTRLTFINKEKEERITCDYQLNITSYDDQNKTINLEHLCIIEVKRSKCRKHSIVTSILLKHKIFLRGMSKYCIGLAIINDKLKSNRFKEKLRMLDKFKSHAV